MGHAARSCWRNCPTSPSRGRTFLRQIADRKHIAADHTEDLNLWAARQRLAWGQRFAEHYRHVAEKAAGE